MRIPNVGLGGVARQSRFMPGWWILPGLILSAVGWGYRDLAGFHALTCAPDGDRELRLFHNRPV